MPPRRSLVCAGAGLPGWESHLRVSTRQAESWRKMVAAASGMMMMIMMMGMVEKMV